MLSNWEIFWSKHWGFSHSHVCCELEFFFVYVLPRDFKRWLIVFLVTWDRSVSCPYSFLNRISADFCSFSRQFWLKKTLEWSTLFLLPINWSILMHILRLLVIAHGKCSMGEVAWNWVFWWLKLIEPCAIIRQMVLTVKWVVERDGLP